MDPVSGWVTDPQSWNRYAYARNNPLKYVDPRGRRYTATISGCEGKAPDRLSFGCTVESGTFGDDEFSSWLSENFLTASGKGQDGCGLIYSGSTRVGSYCWDNPFSDLGSPGNGSSDDGSDDGDAEDAGEESHSAQVDRWMANCQKYLSRDTCMSLGGFDSVFIPGPLTVVTKGMTQAALNTLKTGGIKGLQNGIKNLEVQIAKHITKIAEVKAAGGHTSSMEREVRAFVGNLQAMKDLLTKLVK